MAATVQIRRLNGAGPTSTDITGTTDRASTSDTVGPGTSNPIPIPSVGSSNISAVGAGADPTITTSTNHGLVVGDMVKIASVGGATGVNGVWKVTTVGTSTTFTIGVGAPGTYTSGGTARKVNCSFWVVTQLNCTVAPANGINNLKWYSDGTNSQGTGVTTIVGTATSYVQATGTTGTTGNALSELSAAGPTNGYGATLTINHANDIFTYTSGSPLAVTGSIGATTGAFGDRVIYQVVVDSSAGPGTLTAEQVTWSYDET